MATGYDTRQGARDTFASEGPAVERIGGRVAPSGESRGAQLVGGQSEGGAPNAEITHPGMMAGDLGEFFGKLVEPYLERVKTQRFFEGMTRAQAGESIEELSTSHKNVVGRLFGPTPLEQGAQFYTAMKTVDDWNTKMVSDMDRLKQLSPQELSKELADTSLGLMGDDPFVNQLVQKQLIEKSGPLVDTITKQRYIWQQGEAGKAMFGAMDSAADSLQAAAVAQASVTDPTDDQTAALEVSKASFLGLMQKPQGMSDDTYRKTLGQAMTGFAQRGNFYAYEAMAEAGVMQQLDPEDVKKVEDAYDRYSAKTLDEAKGNHIEELLAVREAMEKGALGIPGGMSPLEAVAAVDNINAAISRETGLRKRAYDAGYLAQTGTTVIDMIASQARAQQSRTQAKADRAEEKAADQRDEEAEARENYSAAAGAFNLGQPMAFLRAGGDHASLDRVFWKSYGEGKIGHIIQAFSTEGYVDNGVAKRMQAKVRSGKGEAYTGEVEAGYKEWQVFNERDPAAALAYYGTDTNSRLLRMHSLITANTPKAQAYALAFGDSGTGSSGLLRPQDRKETMKAIEPQIAKFGSGWFGRFLGYGTREMGDGAQRVLRDTITSMAATIQQRSHQSPTEIAETAAKAAYANNAFEYYGGNMAWTNHPGTRRISDFLTLTPKQTGDLVYSEIDERLKAVGVADGADTSYQILRTPADKNAGGFILTVLPQDGVPINITGKELRERADREARSQIGVDNRPVLPRLSSH